MVLGWGCRDVCSGGSGDCIHSSDVENSGARTKELAFCCTYFTSSSRRFSDRPWIFMDYFYSGYGYGCYLKPFG